MEEKDRIIKVVVPTQEEIDKLAELGIDVEAHLVKVFRDELHMRLHPGDEKGRGLLN